MKRFLTLFIVTTLLAIQSSYAQGSIVLQDKDFIIDNIPDSIILKALDTSEAYQQLSEIEKEGIYWINYVRLYPKRFEQNVLQPFLYQFPEVKSSYTQSLAKDLNGMQPVGLLIPAAKLIGIANQHAKDLGTSGKPMSHNSSKGESFQQRMNKNGIYNCISENIYQGKYKGLESVLFLLIDNGVPSLGHRKNILDKTMHGIGISFYPMKGTNSMYYSVQNFYCGDHL